MLHNRFECQGSFEQDYKNQGLFVAVGVTQLKEPPLLSGWVSIEHRSKFEVLNSPVIMSEKFLRGMKKQQTNH